MLKNTLTNDLRASSTCHKMSCPNTAGRGAKEPETIKNPPHGLREDCVERVAMSDLVVGQTKTASCSGPCIGRSNDGVMRNWEDQSFIIN